MYDSFTGPTVRGAPRKDCKVQLQTNPTNSGAHMPQREGASEMRTRSLAFNVVNSHVVSEVCIKALQDLG
jgi:hypothetical protein